MLEKTFPLSSKMRINADYEKLENFSQKHVKFYLKYSSFVFRSLKKPVFQKFLHWMLKKEKIEEQAVKAVYVKVLPLRRKNGKGIADPGYIESTVCSYLPFTNLNPILSFSTPR